MTLAAAEDELMNALQVPSLERVDSSSTEPQTPATFTTPTPPKKTFVQRHKTKITGVLMVKMLVLLLIILIQMEAFNFKPIPSPATPPQAHEAAPQRTSTKWDMCPAGVFYVFDDCSYSNETDMMQRMSNMFPCPTIDDKSSTRIVHCIIRHCNCFNG